MAADEAFFQVKSCGKFFDKYILSREKRECAAIYHLMMQIFTRNFQFADLFCPERCQISGLCVRALQDFFMNTILLRSLEYVESTRPRPVYSDSSGNSRNIQTHLVRLTQLAQHFTRIGARGCTAENMLTYTKIFKDWASCLEPL